MDSNHTFPVMNHSDLPVVLSKNEHDPFGMNNTTIPSQFPQIEITALNSIDSTMLKSLDPLGSTQSNPSVHSSTHDSIVSNRFNRKRSSSAYSIWNDATCSATKAPLETDPVSLSVPDPVISTVFHQSHHSRGMSESASHGQYLSTGILSNSALAPPSFLLPGIRNRSYTTSAAGGFSQSLSSMDGACLDPNLTFSHTPDRRNDPVAPLINQYGSIQGPDIVIGNESSQYCPEILENIGRNFPLNSTPSRIRSQTFSGITPTISDSSMYLLNGREQFQTNCELYNTRDVNQIQSKHFDNSALGVSISNAFDFVQPQTTSNQMLVPMAAHHYVSTSHGTKKLKLYDDVDFNQFDLTTSFENLNLGPTPLLLFDNLPQDMESVKLYCILHNVLANHRALGPILSVRIASSPSIKMALVETANIETAMTLKAAFSHWEIAPTVVLYVAFAKFLSLPGDNTKRSQSLFDSNLGRSSPVSCDVASANPSSINGASWPEKDSNSLVDLGNSNIGKLSLKESLLEGMLVFFQSMKKQCPQFDSKKAFSLLYHSAHYTRFEYQNCFGPLPETATLRRFDAAKLRDLKSWLELPDNSRGDKDINDENTDGSISQLELEQLSLTMLQELPELSYDYFGNTVVQKLFESIQSPSIKYFMVKRLLPYFAQLGIHKNGTWTIQKVISLLHQDNLQLKFAIASALKPFTLKLFNDQFGNYVLQGCVRFGSPFNDFIFEAMIDRFVEISSGRFGARCIRTILEMSHQELHCVSREQRYFVTGLIIEFASELVLSSNGSLLINWFLDLGPSKDIKDFEPSNRYQTITSRLLPNIVKCACHKTASLVILKLLSWKGDGSSRETILAAIFGTFDSNELSTEFAAPSATLESILSESGDTNNGPPFIQKLISNNVIMSPEADSSDPSAISQHQYYITQIRKVLLGLSIDNPAPYKKLMEEVGIGNVKMNRSVSNTRKSRRGFGRTMMSHSLSQGLYAHKVPLPPLNIPAAFNGVGYYGYPDNGYTAGGVQMPIHQFSPQMIYEQDRFGIEGMNPSHNLYPTGHQQIYQHQSVQRQQQDNAVMAQLEQLSLSSAAMGYNSQPNTPKINDDNRGRF